MATYNYKGNKLTGTSTTAKRFPKSGISNARHNETYFNTKTGHVYVCDTPGNAATATWKYHHTAVAHKPDVGVSLGTPTRDKGRYKFTAKWTVPKALTNEKNGRRAEGLYITWSINVPGRDPLDIWKSGDENRNSDFCWLSDFRATKPKKNYTRDSFYPLTKVKVSGVSLNVRPWNAKGKGPGVTKTCKISTPRIPTLAATDINEYGVVSCRITTNAGEDAREWYRTRVQIDVYDSSTARPRWVNVADYTTRSTSHTATRQVANWQVAGKYVKVRFRALAQGLAGDSAWTDYKTHVVGWPNAATINGKKVKVPGKTSDAIATFPISVNEDSNHKTDEVILQILANSDATTAAQATADTEGWRDTDYKDDGKCTALACSVGNLLPQEGKHTWVRVKSWHDVEGVFYIYSQPYEVSQLFTSAPSAADDAVAIAATEQGVNGSSYKVTLAWNADGLDDSDGTQLTWSDEPDAWESTEKPQEFEFTESDGPLTVGTTTYRDSRTLVIKGLAEGEPTYIRARRYMDDVDGNRTYGPWSDQATVIPTVAPSDVVLTAPAFAAAGADIQYSWSFGGGGTQRAWQLVDNATQAVIAEGTDALGSTVVPAARAATFAVDGALSAFARVSTGGDFVAGEPVGTRIVQAPTLAIGEISTLTAQPLALTLACNVSTARLAVVITSHGIDKQTAHGVVRQPAGDAVWSAEFAPEWTASGTGYAHTLTLPDGCAFIDKGTYTVTATATDTATGLASETQTAGFDVEWAAKAPLPGAVTLAPAVVEDDEGGIDRTCAITLTAPADAPTGSLYDVYRVTHEGARLIAEGYPLEATVTDAYAPFGDVPCAYRVSCRTPDGDEHWADFDYTLDGSCLRLDWDGTEYRYVELPYDIGLSDAYEKDYEGRTHMDGSRGGGWNPGVERTGKLTTDVLRIEDPATVAAIYDMAQSAVPVFVRTPAGAAFEANVEASMDYDGDQVLNVSLDAEECGLTADYMLPPYEYVPVTDDTEETEGE